MEFYNFRNDSKITNIKMIKQIILSLITFIVFNVKAQDFDNYQPLKCSGDIPADFTDRVINKAEKDIKANTDKTDSYGDKKRKTLSF